MTTISQSHAIERMITMRVERARRGLTQKQLAAILGIGKNTVQRIEHGASVSDQMLALVECKLGVSL